MLPENDRIHLVAHIAGELAAPVYAQSKALTDVEMTRVVQTALSLVNVVVTEVEARRPPSKPDDPGGYGIVPPGRA